MCPGRHPNSFPLNKSEFCPAGFAYLDRWLNHDPGRKHQTGIQRLGSNTKVNSTLGVTGPDVLIPTCQTGQSYSSCRETIHTVILLSNDYSFSRYINYFRGRQEATSAAECWRMSPGCPSKWGTEPWLGCQVPQSILCTLLAR